MLINFEWDPAKEIKNITKHKISFELAASIFNDPNALSIYDEKHSNTEEDRWITLGISKNGTVLVVVHTYEELEENKVKIRIISSRKATKTEKTQYQGE